MGSSIRADLAPVTRLADDLAGPLLRDALTDIADTVERDVLDVGRQATGGDLRMSRYGGKGGRRGGTKMTVDTRVTDHVAALELEPAGMWALAIGGAKPHFVGPGSRTRGGRPRRRHPGSTGRGSLDQVYDQIPDLAVATIDDAIDRAIN